MVQEKQYKVTAFIITFLIHLLLLLFLFLFVLRTPIPPFTGGQGVVLNLGYVDEGTGEVQTLNDPNDSPINEENRPLDETVPEPAQETDNTPSEPAPNADGNLLTGTEQNDVQTEASKETTTNNNKAETAKQETATEKPKPKETPKVNAKAIFGGQEGTATNGGNNNGDKSGKVGDQGNPQGDINAKALYGNMGSGGDGSGGAGGGASLDLAGWRWERKPKVKDDNEDENGKIVFQITIDDQGDIISIVTVEKTVSPAVEKIYRQEVEKLTFVKTDNKIPAATSSGKITFIIRSR